MDYEIEITFAPILCKINVNAGENGSAKAEKSVVNYNESTDVTIIANEGYCIDEVKVNGEDKKHPLHEAAKTHISFQLKYYK